MTKENRVNLTLPKEHEKDILKNIKEFKYSNIPEFIRETIREKLYDTLCMRSLTKA